MKILFLAMCWLWQDPIPDPVPLPPAPAPQDPVASIEVVNSAGEPVVGEIGVGQMVILKSDKAKHANVEGSLTWIIEPQLQTFSADGGKTIIVNTGLKPEVLRIMQIVSSLNGKNTYQRISIVQLLDACRSRFRRHVVVVFSTLEQTGNERSDKRD